MDWIEGRITIRILGEAPGSILLEQHLVLQGSSDDNEHQSNSTTQVSQHDFDTVRHRLEQIRRQRDGTDILHGADNDWTCVPYRGLANPTHLLFANAMTVVVFGFLATLPMTAPVCLTICLLLWWWRRRRRRQQQEGPRPVRRRSANSKTD